jgi:phosphoenolpyruvate carboxylase
MFAVRRLAATPRRVAVTTKAVRHFSKTMAPSANYSSFSDPDASTLFKVDSRDLKNPRDAQLRADIRTMGSLLGQIINDHHGQDIFDKVERMRGLAKSWREAGAGRISETADDAASTFNELSSFASSLSDEELFLVSRAFTHFLAIANAAEGHHRSRRIQEREPKEGDIHALSNKSDSCGGVLPDLAKKHDKDTIWDALTTQVVELVLTAHPTEVNRRTILNKQRRVQQVYTMIETRLICALILYSL